MKNAFSHRALAGVAVFLAGGIGLFALGLWTLGRWDLMMPGADYKPMAPDTAALLVVLAVAMGARLLWEGARAAEFATMIGTALSAVVGAAELVRHGWNFPLPWDLWNVHVETSFGVMTSGRMAPLTAVNFLLATAAIAAQGEWLGRYRAARRVASLAAWAGLLICAVMVPAYAVAPLLGYKLNSLSMALLATVAFVILYAGILLADKGDEWLRAWRRAVAEPVGADTPQGPRFFAPRMIMATVAFVFATGIGALYYLRNEQLSVLHEAHEELLSIAELKTTQISEWRRERLSDARVLAKFPGLPDFIAQIAGNPMAENPERARLADYLADVRRLYAYEQIVVLDRGLNPVMTEPSGMTWDKDMPTAMRKAVAESHDVLVQDLHRGGDGRTKLDLLAPVRAGGGHDFAGAILLTIDADAPLFKQLQEWPAPSASGEVLLVCREDDQVVYLNELRHAHGASLKLRFPLAHPTLLAARALRRDGPGLIQGVDYRGVPAIGVAHPVPDSPWTVIAKMDQAEAYAPAREKAVQVFIGLGLLGIIGALFGRTLWQQRQRDLIRSQLSSERTARAANERLTLVMQHAKDVIMLFDEDMRIVEANDRVLEVYGRTPAEMKQLNVWNLRTKEPSDIIKQDFSRALNEDGVTFETIHERKDGSTFPVEVSSRPVEVDGRRHVLSIIRDITQRKVNENEILRLNRMYRLISEVNQVLVRAKNRAELFAEIARVLVKTGQFPIVWIGLLNKETWLIESVAVAGDEHGYVPGIRISINPALPESRGPSGTAFREGRTHVCNDFFAEPGTEPWRERASRSGFQSTIALPLRCEGEIVGLLTIYAAERAFFKPRKIELMEETAADISFALGIFAGEARRHEVETALRESKTRYDELVRRIPAGIYSARINADGAVQFEYASDRFLRMFGLDPEKAPPDADCLSKCIHPDDRTSLAEANRRVAETRGAFAWEGRYQIQGETRWLRIESEPTVLPDGGCMWNGVVIDITDEKQAEIAVEKSNSLLSATLESTADGILVVSVDGQITGFNRRFLELWQIPEKMIGARVDAKLLGFVLDQLQNPEAFRAKVEELYHDQAARSMDELMFKDGRVFERYSQAQHVGETIVGRVWSFRNITERKRAEAELRKLSLAVEQSPASIVITDLAGTIEYVNPRFTELSGYAAAEVRGQNPRVLKSGLTDPSVYVDLWRTITGGAVWRGEIINRKKNGELYTELVVITSVKDAQGQVTHYVALKEDITARKAAEEALRESDTRLAQVAAHSRTIIWEVDAAGLYTFVSDVCTAVIGYQPGELTGRKYFYDLHPEEGREAFKTAALEAFARKDAFTGLENMIQAKDGGIVWVSTNGIPILNPDGTLKGYRGSDADITTRKLAENTLRKFSRIIDQAPISVAITELTGALEYVNPRFCQVTGYTIEEVLGQNPRVLKSGHTPPEVYDDMWQTLTKGLVWRGELHNRKKNGDFYTETAVIAPVSDDSGRVTHYVALKEDITERKRTEAALLEIQERYRLIAENTDDVIWLYDIAQDRFTYASPSMRKLSGFTPEEFVGKAMNDVLTPASQDYVARILPPRLAAFAAGDETARTAHDEVDQVRRDGGSAPIEVVSTLLADAEGKPVQILGATRDITERRRADAALREREQRYRELFDLESEAIILLESSTGRIIQANQAASLLYGYTAAEFETLRNLDLSAEPEKTLQINRSATHAENTVITIPHRLHRKRDGTVFPVEVKLRNYERAGRLLQLAAIRDITLEVAARETLQRFNAELEEKVVLRTEELAVRNLEMEALLQSIPDMVIKMHADGTVLTLQPAKGATPLAVTIGKSYHPPEGSLLDPLIKTVLPLGRRALAENTTVDIETELILGNSPVVTELRVAPIGKAEFVVFARDITERKRLESALKESSDRLNMAVQAGHVGIWDYDLKSQKLVWDQQMLSLYGLTPDQFGGAYEAWQNGVHPDDRKRGDEEIQLALRGEKNFDTEFRVVWADGSIHDIRALALVQRDAAGRPVRMIGTNWDITEQKRIEAEIAANLEKERQVSEMKTRFISVTSHEFRTPMAAAMVSADMLSNHFDRIAPAKRLEMLGRIMTSLHRMTSMLDDVLTLNRMDANRTEVRLAPLDLRAFTQSAIDEIRLGDHDAHRWELHAAGDTAHFVTDANLLHHILSNLLSNAVRYSHAGTDVTVRIEADALRTSIMVEDHGIGIPEADRARIFKSFERGSNVGTIKGTGLGLNIVKRMVELLGGTVGVDAVEGGGSRFTVTFPLINEPSLPS